MYFNEEQQTFMVSMMNGSIQRILSDAELLELYQHDPEKAAKDCRLKDVLDALTAKPEPTEEELAQAELLLNQMDIINKQQEQDEVLATILLNGLGV